MNEDIRSLEHDIEETRARLDLTINRLQDKLSMSGIVDDLLGSVRGNRYASVFDHALAVLRRNPVPVMLVAAGIGWLIHRASQQEAAHADGTADLTYDDDVPVLATGHSRIYDPDTSTLHPTQDTLEGRRELNARA
jgi:Protein of unknown function (DUF3618)